MIGYYVHHVGRGHLSRAEAIVRELPEPVTVLSSLPRPDGWTHGWVQLDRDDDGDPDNSACPPLLHWAPLDHRGHQRRMATIAGWIAAERPDVLVCDVSVEVTLLGRMLGVPVVTMVLPGDRRDEPHQLGFRAADAIVAPWPDLSPELCPGLGPHAAKVVHVGGISRFAGRSPDAPTGVRDAVLVLSGLGGAGVAAEYSLPADLRVVRCGSDSWVEDPWPLLTTSAIVVSHCGLGALADIATARRPAVLVPQPRPHDEQRRTAQALGAAGLAVINTEPRPDWNELIERARGLDPDRWTRWAAPGAARRAAAVVVSVAERHA